MWAKSSAGVSRWEHLFRLTGLFKPSTKRGVVHDTRAAAWEPETSDITVLRPMLAMSRCSAFLPDVFVTLLHRLSDISCSLESATLRTSKPRLQYKSCQ